MSKTREQIEKQLDENIPADAVAKRSGGGATKLSYLESWYVEDRLNKIFGNLGWDVSTELYEVTGAKFPTYRAHATITASVAEYDKEGTLVGYTKTNKDGWGWGADKGSLNPHEMACKEAESDALKRAAKKFGLSMGLALYDKSGEFVDAPEKPAPAPKAVTVTTTTTETVPVVATRTDINASITSNGKVCIAKGVYTKETFQAMRKEKYGVDTTEALTDAQANELLTILKKEAQDGKRTT